MLPEILSASPAVSLCLPVRQVPGPVPVSETAVHPLEYDPVTNEHTAKMTMARTAALEHYNAGK